MGDFSNFYKTLPALAKYIDHIKAEPRNFRRYIVSEREGKYRREKAVITIRDDKTINWWPRDGEHAPTEHEEAEINAELAKAVFPISVPATHNQVEQLKKSGKIKGKLDDLRVVVDVSRKHVLMCQERRDTDDGKKYIPWTMYSADGKTKAEWQQMEPDGLVPFWKPMEKRGPANVMVHEGAKAAWNIDSLLHDPMRKADKKDYPPEWIEFLAGYEHWGSMTGAEGMRHCDCSELIGENSDYHIVYSCDNDDRGIESAKTFSRNLPEREIRTLIYDNHTFTPGWDLGDPLPAELFDKNGHVKRTLEAMLQPATWATVEIEREKKTRGPKPHALTNKFRKEWIHATDVGMIYHAWLRGFEFSERAFNKFIRPFSHVDDTARLVNTSLVGRVSAPTYDPSRKYGEVYAPGDASGKLYFNKYTPGSIKDYTTAEARHVNYSPMVGFFEYLIPDAKDRHETIKWCATLCIMEAVKMDYALLVVSQTHGVGKNTLGRILEKIVGEHNTSQPNEKSLKDERNTWAANRRLAIISEIYQGQSRAVYNMLKSLITEKVIWVNEKFIPEHQVPNWNNIYAASNSKEPLKFDDSDRRWLVPRVTEHKLEHEFWVGFNDWLDNQEGFRKAKLFFKHFIDEHGHVLAGAHAPDTSAKREMIREGYSAGQEIAERALEFIRDAVKAKGNIEVSERRDHNLDQMLLVVATAKEGKPMFVTDKDGVVGIEQNVEDTRYERLKPATIHKVARHLGFFVGEELNKSRKHLTLNARVIALDPDIARTLPVEVISRLEAKEVVYINLADPMGEMKPM
jgi:hypothetical protein